MWSLLLVFMSSLDRNLVKGNSVSSALDPKKSVKEMFCSKVSSLGDKFLYEVSDGAEVVRSLVTAAGTLVDCSISGDTELGVSFTRKCSPGRRDGTEAQYERMDEARLLCERFTQTFQQSHKTVDQEHRRVKRGFTYPGTLWCGAGNMADSYNQLGDFAETDSCCRTHDHCPHVIHAFSSNYGHTNFKWHSLSHCDCDEALKACLRKVNHTSSRVVGQAFFNVLEAPCFDLTYEEQCVERHWYGLCKRVEKRPVAVLRKAVPYDFGGIEVIDELKVAPIKKKDSYISKEKVQPEMTTKSSVSQPGSPEEPSLTNVVTAAEDFIKVLATVSTSQSSTADSDKADAQGSEKKKKPSEKKNKSKKTNGKGRKKKKQQQENMVKIEDSGAVPLSNPKAEKDVCLSNFISESRSPEELGRSSNKASENEYELGGREETSNEVMKDAPALDEEDISTTARKLAKKKPANNTFLSTVVRAEGLHRAKRKWLQNREKKVERTSDTSDRKVSVDTSRIEVPKVKRNGSKLRKDREEREKRLKTSAESEEKVEDDLKESHTPKQQLSQEADGSKVTLPHPSFSELKRQRHRSKEKGITEKKRKGLALINEHFSQSNVEEATLPTHSPAVTDQSPRTRQLFTSTTSKPSVNAKTLLNKRRGKTKKSKPQSSALRAPKAGQRHLSKPAVKTTDSSFQAPQPTTSSSALSPMQITIEKVKEQFERKRKRKIAISSRQQ